VSPGTDPLSVLELLARTRPQLHGQRGVLQDWGLREEVLRWLWATVQPGMSTLEIGCGHSTIIFAARGTHHVTVTPDDAERDRVVAWCRDHGISVERVEFLIGPSQEVLPALEHRPLDLALIDGSHAFPLPSLDWYYTATQLIVGGLVVVDDTDIRPVRQLFDFLAAERDRWRVNARFAKTAAFEKLCEDVLDGEGWLSQPYCRGKLLGPGEMLTALRNRARIRTRLRLRRSAPTAPT
jgi:predicted O-methyltransferase YrrM